MDINMDRDNDNGDNADSASKLHSTEKASSNPYKTNDRCCSAKNSNPIDIKDEIIDLGDDLEMTDDDEKAHIASVSSEIIYEATPIKLKKVKHEVKTQFSEIDIVDLSDDETGAFPYSQLFDIKYENHTESKVEIKQECNDNDDQNNERIDLNEHDEIIHSINLTDDEDEDNPWLERLSRSQLLNEDKKPELISSANIIVKNEIDLGIWENDEISNILQPDVFTYEPDNEIVFASHANKIDDTKDTDTLTKDTDSLTAKIIEPMDVSDINRSNEISLKKTDSKQNTHMELHVEHVELNKLKEPDNLRVEYNESNTTKEPDDLMRKSNYLTGKRNFFLNSVSTESASTESAKSKSIRSKKLISIIEAQNLPAKKRSQSQHRKEKKEKQKEIDEKTQSKLTAEKKTLKIQMKKQINKNVYSNQCYKKAHSSAINCSLLTKSKSKAFITKEEKKIIIEKRKVKLKEIAKEEKKTAEKTVKRGTAIPKTKISLTNRGDFLITEKVSKPVLNKSTKPTSKPSDNQSKNLSMKKTEILEKTKDEDFNEKLQEKSCRKQNVSKNTMDNIVTTLQQSLYLNNIASGIQITEKDSIENPEAINKEKKYDTSKGRKKHEIISDHDAKTSKLVRSKSTERISILVQKENFSPNSKSAEKSKIMHDRVKSIAESSKQKKVTFSDKVEIREYTIETQNSLKRMVGKDAPIPTNKLVKTTSTTCTQWLKLEEFLLRIFMWNPVWLEEQRYLKCMPPIVSRELQPMKLFYTSYQEYYTIMMPLLLLEIWYTMTKDFNDVEKNMKRVTAMCYIVENSITHTPVSSMNMSMTTLMIEVLVEKQDLNKTHPIYGDLVSLEYGINEHGKRKFHKVFAYVSNMHQTIITDFTNYNKDLRNYVKKPYAVVTYTLLTRLLEHNIAVNRVQRIRTVTYLRANIRMVRALQYLPRSPLLNLILNPKVEDYQLPLMNETLLTSSSKFIEDNLNPKQLEVICRVSESVLRQESKVCFIQGPPGTGKSKVIMNLVSRILYGNYRNKRSLRILVCAPSNAVIDEIVLRLLAARSSFKPKYGGFNIVRIGQLESMHPMAKNISVTELARRYVTQINHSSKKEEIMDLQTRINSLQNILASSGKMDEMKRKEIEKKLDDTYAKYKIMKFFNDKTWDEFNAKERAKVTCLSQDMILKGANVITCTLSSCYTNQMETLFGSKNKISVCIVDEATQSCEAETLIPLMLDIKTLVLVGDPNQLPATILSQQAKKLGLDQSIFSRMQNIFASESKNPILMLDTQYRMDCAISYWPNKYFYDSRLKNASQIITRLPFCSYIVLNHNSTQNNDKFSNTTEAEFVANIIYVIIAFTKWDNIDEKVCIGVLTPYNNQRTLIRNKINGK